MIGEQTNHLRIDATVSVLYHLSDLQQKPKPDIKDVETSFAVAAEHFAQGGTVGLVFDTPGFSPRYVWVKHDAVGDPNTPAIMKFSNLVCSGFESVVNDVVLHKFLDSGVLSN